MAPAVAPATAPAAAVAPDAPGQRDRAASLEALGARYVALVPRLAAGTADPALDAELDEVLAAHESMLARTAPGSAERNDLQWRVAQITGSLARSAALQGRAADAERLFGAAATAWEAAGEPGQADDCRARQASAALAGGADLDAALQGLRAQLDAAKDDPASLRRAALRTRLAELLAAAGDHFGAQQAAAEAAAELAALGYADPFEAPSVDAAFAVWVACGHGEPAAALAANRTQALLSAVATTWAALGQVRIALDPRGDGRLMAAERELAAVVTRLGREAEEESRLVTAAAAARGMLPVPDSDAGAALDAAAGTSTVAHEEALALAAELAACADDAAAVDLGAEQADQLQRRVGDLEQATWQRGLPLLATSAASLRADVLVGLGRPADAEQVLDAARSRLGDGDGLAPAERRSQQVSLLTRSAMVATMQGELARASARAGEGIALAEADRRFVNEPFLADSYLRDRGRLYAAGVFAAWKLGDDATALARADLAKARGSLGWLPVAGAGGGQLDPSELAGLRAQWDRMPPPNGDDAIASERRRELWSRLVTAEARARRRDWPELDLAALQATLAPDEAVVSQFWLSRTTLLIATVDRSAFVVERRTLDAGQRAELDSIAADLATLTNEEVDWLERYLPPLGKQLLPEQGAALLERKRRLVISPHRVLHQIPFCALELQGSVLAERFALSYVPSLATLLATRASAAERNMLALGIGRFPGTSLPSLERTEDEAEAVAGAYRATGWEATLLRGEEAGRAALAGLRACGQLGRFRVLHLATHGADGPPEDPNGAVIALADGPLDAMELSQFELSADLVVLSACWSGRRPTVGRHLAGAAAAGAEELFGDEIYGLQAALFAAGARQVLGSLWPLFDTTAPAVMLTLHRLVAEGEPAELALQAALAEQRKAGAGMQRWAPFKLVVLGRDSAATPPAAGPPPSPEGADHGVQR